jgi:DNA-binding CsgD family transcriptional regulator
MSDLVEMVQQVSGQHRSRLDRLIQPLITSFGIHAFGYYQIGVDGGITFLGNLPHVSEYYFGEELYKGNPFLKHPDLVPSGYILADTAPSQEFLDAQSLMQKKFGLEKLLLIFEREGDLMYGYGIATTSHDANMMNVYLNHLDKFRSYCHYFREQTQDLQQILNSSKLNMSKIIGDDFFCGNNKRDVRLEHATQKRFFNQLQLFEYQHMLKPLSKREVQCLQLLLQGNSASKIALRLSLSVRTVEHYIENIKNKLCCSSRRELFEFGETLFSFGFELSILEDNISF